MDPSPLEMVPSFAGVIVTLAGILLTVVWILLPFAVFGIKSRLDEGLAAQRKILAQLERLTLAAARDEPEGGAAHRIIPRRER